MKQGVRRGIQFIENDNKHNIDRYPGKSVGYEHHSDLSIPTHQLAELRKTIKLKKESTNPLQMRLVYG